MHINVTMGLLGNASTSIIFNIVKAAIAVFDQHPNRPSAKETQLANHDKKNILPICIDFCADSLI